MEVGTGDPFTLQQNGILERKHHCIMETAMSILLSFSAPSLFWVEIVLITIYLIYRMPSGVLSLFELLYVLPCVP